MPWRITTRSERIRHSEHWILKLNQDGRQQPLNQRPDFAQAKRECKRSHDECMARTKRLRELKNVAMQSTLEQAGGSMNQRGESRLRRHRPRPRIGKATIGRQEVGIPGILHGLIIRENFLR